VRATLATTSAAFLNHAFESQNETLHNHLSFDRRWLDEQDQRTVKEGLGAGIGVGVALSELQMMAGQLFALAVAPLTGFTSPRAWAFG